MTIDDKKPIWWRYQDEPTLWRCGGVPEPGRPIVRETSSDRWWEDDDHAGYCANH